MSTTASWDILYELIISKEQRIVALEEENYRLQETVQLCVDDMMANAVKKEVKSDAPAHTLKKQPSLKWAPFKGSRSPTKAEHESPSSSPQALEHHIPVSTCFSFLIRFHPLILTSLAHKTCPAS